MPEVFLMLQAIMVPTVLSFGIMYFLFVAWASQRRKDQAQIESTQEPDKTNP
jgi:preprotein translocase subunit YajC